MLKRAGEDPSNRGFSVGLVRPGEAEGVGEQKPQKAGRASHKESQRESRKHGSQGKMVRASGLEMSYIQRK